MAIVPFRFDHLAVDGRVDMEVEGILRVGTGSRRMARLVGCSASPSCSGLHSSLPTGLIRGRTRMCNGERSGRLRPAIYRAAIRSISDLHLLGTMSSMANGSFGWSET
jgi:hypothetical protein